MNSVRASAAIAVACLMLTSVPSFGAGDSLCVRFTGSSGGETITLSRDRVISGELPVTLCGMARGEVYRLELNGVGFERRVAKVRIGMGEASVSGIRIGAMCRNAVVPGAGAMHAGRPAAAATDDVSLAASLIALVHEQREYEDLRDRSDALQALVDAAETVDEAEEAQDAAREAARMANVQNAYRRRLVVLCGALYGWQVIEPLFVDAPPHSTAGIERGTIALEGARLSRSRAFLHSLVHPGRGQFYQGKTVRGFIYSAATLAAGIAALEFQNRYEVAAEQYELCLERFESSTSVTEKAALASAAAVLRASADDEDRNFTISLVALGAIWGWNCVDTFFGADDARYSRYSIAVDARGAALAVRF